MLHVHRMAALAREKLIVVVARVMRQGEFDGSPRGVSERLSVQSRRRPAGGGVAGVTFLRKHALVNIWLGMAIGTGVWGVFQAVGGVAFCAG